jgi:hypothetical protein
LVVSLVLLGLSLLWLAAVIVMGLRRNARERTADNGL